MTITTTTADNCRATNITTRLDSLDMSEESAARNLFWETPDGSARGAGDHAETVPPREPAPEPAPWRAPLPAGQPPGWPPAAPEPTPPPPEPEPEPLDDDYADEPGAGRGEFHDEYADPDDDGDDDQDDDVAENTEHSGGFDDRPAGGGWGMAVSIPAAAAPRPYQPPDPDQWQQWIEGEGGGHGARAVGLGSDFDRRTDGGRTLRRTDARPAIGRRVVAVLVVLGMIAVLGAVVLAVIHSGRSSPKHRPAPTAAAVAAGSSATTTPDTTSAAPLPGAPDAWAAPGCVDGADGDTITGTQPGGHDSPAAVVQWIEHSYYVARDAGRLRQVVDPAGKVHSAHAIQRGINSVPLGTTYCLSVSPGSDSDHWNASIEEVRPGTQPATWRQVMTVRQDDNGGYLVTDIENADQ